MKEVKTPKKPLAYYYGIVLIVLIVFNLVVTPRSEKNSRENWRKSDGENENGICKYDRTKY